MKIKRYLKEAQLTDIIINFAEQHNKKRNELESKALKQFRRYIKVAKEEDELHLIYNTLEDLDIDDDYRDSLLDAVSRKMK